MVMEAVNNILKFKIVIQFQFLNFHFSCFHYHELMKSLSLVIGEKRTFNIFVKFKTMGLYTNSANPVHVLLKIIYARGLQ